MPQKSTESQTQMVFIAILASFVLLFIAIILLFTQTNSQTSLSTTPAATPSPVNELTYENDLSSWQTYQNEKYGFEFQYPNTLTYQNLGQEIYSFNTKGSFIEYVFQVSDNPKNLTVEKWVQNNEKCGFTKKSEGQPIVVAGITGIKINESMTCPPGGSGKEVIVYLLKNNKIYQFYLINAGEEIIQADFQLFDQILSTFKFTN